MQPQRPQQKSAAMSDKCRHKANEGAAAGRLTMPLTLIERALNSESVARYGLGISARSRQQSIKVKAKQTLPTNKIP